MQLWSLWSKVNCAHIGVFSQRAQQSGSELLLVALPSSPPLSLVPALRLPAVHMDGVTGAATPEMQASLRPPAPVVGSGATGAAASAKSVQLLVVSLYWKLRHSPACLLHS